MPAAQPTVHRPARLLLILLLSLCGPGACSSQSAPSDPAQRPAQLLDTEWAFVEVAGLSAPLPAGPAAATLTLASAGGQLSGSTGCNRMQGSYEHPAEGSLRFGPVAATKRGCPPDLATVEKGVLEALAATTGYDLGEGSLELRAGDRRLARLAPSRPTE
jgi:heat shock protein HslJ